MANNFEFFFIKTTRESDWKDQFILSCLNVDCMETIASDDSELTFSKKIEAQHTVQF